jgi:hypothetical protein
MGAFVRECVIQTLASVRRAPRAGAVSDFPALHSLDLTPPSRAQRTCSEFAFPQMGISSDAGPRRRRLISLAWTQRFDGLGGRGRSTP